MLDVLDVLDVLKAADALLVVADDLPHVDDREADARREQKACPERSGLPSSRSPRKGPTRLSPPTLTRCMTRLADARLSDCQW